MFKKSFSAILALIWLSIYVAPAAADVAPPRKPPGNSILPGQETQVQMAAENVLMVVRPASEGPYIVSVTADFAMRNRGEQDERMRVRFPLENTVHPGDGWGGRPEIRDFVARVNGVRVPAEESEEPYDESMFKTLKWSTFEASFPAGKDTLISVSYVTDLQQEDMYPPVEYILGTGAGWFDTIGTATLTVRLPYAVGKANILYPDPDTATLVGKEIRWHWRDYEPKTDEVIRVSIVNPAAWQRILDLEAHTGENPNDIDAVIELSKAYQEAGSEKHGCMVNPEAAELSEIAVEQALALHPGEIRLHLQLIEVYTWRLGCRNLEYSSFDPVADKLLDELRLVLELDPGNVQIQEALDSWQSRITEARIPTHTPRPTSTRLPTRTLTLQPSWRPQRTVTPSPTIKLPAIILTTPPQSTEIVTLPPANASQSDSGVSWAFAGGLAGIILTVASILIVRTIRSKPRR